MTTDKIRQIIARKNERLEQDAVSQAQEIIEAIAQRQADIAKATKDIEELRADLKKLEISTVDETSILG